MENIVQKGEIDCNVFAGNNFNPLLHRYSFWRINNKTAFENIEGNGEIACNKQFLLSHNVFHSYQIIVSPFVHIFDAISLFAAEFEKPKFGISDKG